jgi:hypothetical protein
VSQAQLELTLDFVQAFAYLLDLAFSDQAVYLGEDQVFAGYGGAWAEQARSRASLCYTLARLTAVVGEAGDCERWQALARDFEGTLVAASVGQ